jgi:toxin ParE1/3/4
MLAVNWRPEARLDLSEIFDFIAAKNLTAAEELVERLSAVVEALPNHPYLYRPGRKPGTRELVVHPNYIVVYQVSSHLIEILGIVHARRRYP